MNRLTLGRMRALQSAATQQGIFTILAVDHRDALRALLNSAQPDRVAAEQMTALKLAVVRAIAPQATAVLLDPLYSVGQAIATQALPGRTAFLSALEAQGYLGDPHSRRTTMLEHWSIEKAKMVGASGVKVLLFYHPDAGEATERQEQLVAQLLEQCAQFDMPLFLEPIVYSLDPATPKGTAAFANRRQYAVVESARRLSKLGPDVLKLEFPVDCRFETDQAVWRDACAALNQASSVPWTLLSGGGSFELFETQLQIACENGCSGFLVGRALWQEAVMLDPAERDAFLQTTAAARWQSLCAIAEAHGQPWYARYTSENVDETWYQRYREN